MFRKKYTGLFLFCFVLLGSRAQAQQEPNWTPKQLMEPAELHALLQQKKGLPLILSVGPGASIPHSIHMGMANDPASLEKLRSRLAPLARKTSIVLYCGCCPFENCPNVRPAISLL